MPLQRGQGLALTIWPMIDCRTRRTSPAPPHWAHRTGVVPGRAPVPEQVWQPTGTRRVTSWDAPNTASRKSRVTATSMSLPRGGPAGPREPPPPPNGEAPPKNDWKMSPRLTPPNMSSKPPAPAPAGAGAPQPVGAEHVVAAPPLGVAQRLVGDGDQLEPLLGLGVAVVGVGVELAGAVPVGLLQLVLGGVLADAEQVVEVLDLGHRVSSRSGGGRAAGPRRPPQPWPGDSSCGWGRARRWCRPAGRRPRRGRRPPSTRPATPRRARTR